jgi:hypothetical protein
MNQKLNIDIVAKDKSKQALNSVQGALSRLKGAVFNLQNAFIGLGAGLVARNLVNTGKELENLRVRLKFLLKDTNEGAKAFDNMVKFASKVPFSLEEIQSGSGILATVTDNAKDLNKMLEITGNVAAVTGLDFRTTAEQIQRSFSAGIGAADLFREKGVRNMLGFQAGATVSIEATVEAFEKTFGKGGRFGKATDELAETFQGTLSMIGDKIFNFKKVILEAGLFEGLKKEFGALDKFLEENSKQIDRIAEDIGMSLAFAVKKVADFVIILKDNMDKIVNVFKLLIAIKVVKLFLALGGAIQFAAKQMLKFSLASIMTVKGLKGIVTLIAKGGAVYIAFKGIDKLFEETAKSFDDFSDGVKNVLPPARDLHKTMVQVRDVVSEIDTFLYNYENELGYRIPTATEKAIDKFKELNNTALENIKNKAANIQMIIAEGINNGITKMSEGFARALVFGEKLSDTLRKMAQEVLVRIMAFLIEQIARQTLSIILENTKLGVLIQQTSEMRKQTKEQERQNKAKGTAMLMSGNPMGFLGFMASGGAVGKGQPYMVGENGPELFVPNQSGQIQQNARGGSGGGGSTTVNFNINTVDASGFEELLVRSRGTITQLINSAVNERGSKNLI